jgi:MscS family membrane protein
VTPTPAARPLRLPCLALALAAWAMPAAGADAAHPLRPVDRSSPRATLETFLAAGDAVVDLLEREYFENQSRAGYERMVAAGQPAFGSLDLERVAPAFRVKAGRSAALALYEVLNRIPLPPMSEVPDAAAMAARKDGAAARWTLPDTEVTFVRVDRGAAGVEYLFSPETVARAMEFDARTEQMGPARRKVPDLHAIVVGGGGWMIPLSVIRALPAPFRETVAGQAAWKWVALLLLAACFLPVAWLGLRLSRLGEGRGPFGHALARFSLPLVILVATPVLAWFGLAQVNLTGEASTLVQVTASTVVILVGSWVSWRAAPVVAEAIIASPSIPTESVDAHLIRLGARVLGILGALALLVYGADRMGIPVYGIVAGLGVGGLAFALATQPTLENLIAGLNLFADRPLRIGDKCKVGDATGTVEAIGIRSTRIRAPDRTVTTIPNGALAKVPIHNQSQRDRMQLEATIGLRYETTPTQLRAVLAAFEALLAGHPKVLKDGARVRFVALGPSSLDVLVSAYVDTTRPADFQSVRQELLLAIMDAVEKAGTSFAFPSTTVYLGKDVPPGGAPAA